MTGIRIAWVVLAVATGILGSATAQWPLYEITDCEIGLGPLSSADCYRSIHDYFGREVFLVLALPVALCVIPAVIPRPLVSWIVSATMLCAAVVGFFTAFSSDMPSLLSMAGNSHKSEQDEHGGRRRPTYPVGERWWVRAERRERTVRIQLRLRDIREVLPQEYQWQVAEQPQ
jgi:hypothetical protein